MAERYPDRLRVTVTAEDIANGWPGRSTRCPLARATLRSLGLTRNRIDVTADGALVYGGESWRTTARYRLTPRALSFMRSFDAGKRVKPATFVLRRTAS